MNEQITSASGLVDGAVEKRRAARAHERSKETRASVIYGDRIAKWIISVGGLMVIVAVAGIMVFLVQVVVPLFFTGEVRGQVNYRLDRPGDVAWVNADEFQSLATRVSADGSVTTFHVPTGRTIKSDALDFGGEIATAVGGVLTRDRVAFGFEDGSVRFGMIGFSVTSTPRARVPADLVALDGRDFLSGETIFTEVQTGDFRSINAIQEVGEASQISEFPIVAIDYRVGGTVERPTSSFITVDGAGVGRISRSTIQRNLMTNAETVRTSTATLPSLPAGTVVTDVLLSSAADRAIIAAADGMIYRYDIRDVNNPVLAEQRRVFSGDVAVTSLAFLNAELALVAGGSNGAVDVFFRLQNPMAGTADGYELVRARSHETQGAAVVDISVAQREKALVTLDADGGVWLRHSTSDQTLFKLERQVNTQEPGQVMLFPRADGILLVDDSGMVDAWQYDTPHPEITLGVLFGKVWYEGYSEPGFTWQSTSGTDVFESKYSLVPLIFGTMKATFYAMLFAVPIALMAAIYTSEFVHRNVRATVKPIMETMESLPTVVLGFVAALVLAPLVEEWIGAVLLFFIALPMGLMLGAYLWQMLPQQTTLKLGGAPKFLFMFAAIIVAGAVAYQVGPWFEQALFYGDFKAWTSGAIGTGTPFLFLIGLPLSFVVVSWSFTRLYGHHFREILRNSEKTRAGQLDFLRWIALLAAAMLLSWAVASLLTAIGYDPRGNLVDTYQQRNALVVGFVMAFAVIPNIYTLAEDALNAVPSHLRAGSLAAGATPWQTAMWVILPTAASGVFSAVMIGMGRAVGETMIVVMAAGNTPIMEWNIFSGLRTLSANIAIELPEAVKDGTNYRTLFLAALTLFIMTFIINTVAELIRQRFRKRAFQL
jgi:phosphate transport system permease protein